MAGTRCNGGSWGAFVVNACVGAIIVRQGRVLLGLRSAHRSLANRWDMLGDEHSEIAWLTFSEAAQLPNLSDQGLGAMLHTLQVLEE